MHMACTCTCTCNMHMHNIHAHAHAPGHAQQTCTAHVHDCGTDKLLCLGERSRVAVPAQAGCSGLRDRRTRLWREGSEAVGNIFGSSSRVFSAAISAWLTASHPNSQVKQVRAGVVLRWGTTREGPVLRFLFSLSPSPPFVSLSPSPPSPSLDFCSRVSSSVCRRTLRAHHQHRWMDWRLGPKVERARPEACLPVLLRGFVLLCTSTHTSLCALHWPALP
jgi:hypothetical protein